MELRHLRYFIVVAEELHFTRAAARLHIGQPPLSHAIQMLETDVGAKLFERTKRWVKLTQAGQLFLLDARRILTLSEQAAETARRAQRGETGVVRIGFTFSIPFSSLFAEAITRFRLQYPDVTLMLHEMPTGPQLNALREHSLDLGFIRPPEGTADASPAPNALKFLNLRKDPLMLVLPSSHPFAARSSIAIKDLVSEPFVMYPRSAGTGIYLQIVRLCRDAGFVPHVAQEACEASTIIGLIAAGCGVSILPASFDKIKMEGVCYRPISDSSATTSLLLAHRKDEQAQLVEAFVRLVLAVA